MTENITTTYDLAERGAVGWSASSADGGSSTSGYRAFSDVLDDLAEGAWIIDKADISELPGFVAAVFGCPLHGDPSRNGAYLGALRAAPDMLAVVESYGLSGPTALQWRHEAEGRPGYGPMDYAPAEYHAAYWRDRGARISRYIGGQVVQEDLARPILRCQTCGEPVVTANMSPPAHAPEADGSAVAECQDIRGDAPITPTYGDAA